MHTITGTDRVRAALADPDLRVPSAPPRPRGIAWLRANVARFSDGDPHRRKRELATDLLATVDTEWLRRRAAERTALVPVEVLAEALGLDVPAEAVAVVARAYHPHLPSGPDTDAAVASLVAACGGVWDEATAARIGLLVQACAATTALVRGAVRRGGCGDGDAAAAVAGTLRDDPPVPLTRRVRDGEAVGLDLAGLPFGAGPHACPGRDQAVAIATGMIDAVR